MADIELVVKIPEELKENIDNYKEVDLLDSAYLTYAIRNGTPLPKGHCKDCKFFITDYMAKVDGIPLIVAHEICTTWGNGCKTKEDGFCFMFEPQESEDKA